MLRAAAAFLGSLLIWLLVSQRMNSLADVALALGAALTVVVVGAHFGGGVSAAFARAPQMLALGLSRVKTVLAGAGAVMRAAVAADIKLTPGLVRLKTRSADDLTRADLATMIGGTPGNVVMEADAEGLLIHVMDEHEMDGGDLSALEAHVLRAHGLKA